MESAWKKHLVTERAGVLLGVSAGEVDEPLAKAHRETDQDLSGTSIWPGGISEGKDVVKLTRCSSLLAYDD